MQLMGSAAPAHPLLEIFEARPTTLRSLLPVAERRNGRQKRRLSLGVVFDI